MKLDEQVDISCFEAVDTLGLFSIVDVWARGHCGHGSGLFTHTNEAAEADVTLMGRLPESALVRIVLLDAPRSVSEL